MKQLVIKSILSIILVVLGIIILFKENFWIAVAVLLIGESINLSESVREDATWYSLKKTFDKIHKKYEDK